MEGRLEEDFIKNVSKQRTFLAPILDGLANSSASNVSYILHLYKPLKKLC